jgi:hypothetical protein
MSVEISNPQPGNMTFYQFFLLLSILYKGSSSAAVKLLPCDQEVMGSSPENSLLEM